MSETFDMGWFDDVTDKFTDPDTQFDHIIPNANLLEG